MKAYHVLVAGPSGGGKTTFLRELHDRFDGISVFLTTKKNERKAANNPPRRVRKSSCSYPQDIARVRQWARRRPEAVQVIVDEVQNAPSFRDADGADGPLRDGLHEDRDQAVKYVLATQNPQDLRTRANGYGPVQQCTKFVWVGPSRSFASGFFDWYGISDGQKPQEEYTYHVFEPTDPPRVIGEGTTNRKYA